MALDLEPDEIYREALTVVRRAKRRLWPLRLRLFVRNDLQGLRDLRR
jgi:hypothetical protein